jgi:uncharacterized protein (DUF305 family)
MKTPCSKPGRLPGLLAIALLVGSAAGRSSARNSDPADGFRELMSEATARMHAAMNVPFTGDADRDFARMMIPHHQGAIDMAVAELRYGKDERLRRLAQEIVVSQQQEIQVMHLTLGDALAPGAPAPARNPPNPHLHGEH